MKKKILLTVLALTAVLLATPYIGMVHAKPSTAVSGTIVITGYVPLEILPRGKSDNLIMKVLLTAEFTGDIEGTTTYEAFWMLHNFVPPDGGPNIAANMHEKITFETVTVLGESGSMTMEANMGGNEVWHWTILGGTGGLANLHGHGTWAPEVPGGMVEFYEGQVHFDP
jgi:hypothetical protein